MKTLTLAALSGPQLVRVLHEAGLSTLSATELGIATMVGAAFVAFGGRVVHSGRAWRLPPLDDAVPPLSDEWLSWLGSVGAPDDASDGDIYDVKWVVLNLN